MALAAKQPVCVLLLGPHLALQHAPNEVALALGSIIAIRMSSAIATILGPSAIPNDTMRVHMIAIDSNPCSRLRLKPCDVWILICGFCKVTCLGY